MKFFALAENWVILGVFFYPALYYPLLACGTLHNKVGYVLGSFLSWTHFAVLVWQKIDCPKTPLVSKERFYSTWDFRIKTHKPIKAGPCRRTHGWNFQDGLFPPVSTLSSVLNGSECKQFVPLSVGVNRVALSQLICLV